ncbi:MAG: hypothetical protein Q4C81_04770 [Kocuria sp.]|nr:hypothetical protein [Kocuria sp.]
MITAHRNVRWMFPEDADTGEIDSLSEVIDRNANDTRSRQALPAPEDASKPDLELTSAENQP